jgi:hypothetical protein
MAEVNAQAAEQRQPKGDLDDYRNAERDRALAGRDRAEPLSAGGHPRPSIH